MDDIGIAIRYIIIVGFAMVIAFIFASFKMPFCSRYTIVFAIVMVLIVIGLLRYFGLY